MKRSGLETQTFLREPFGDEILRAGNRLPDLHIKLPKLSIVNILRRYWGVALIMVVVAAHAAVIGYVRSRIAQLTKLETTAIEIGDFCFQNTKEPGTVYQFRLHAVVEPSKLHVGRALLEQTKIQIQEDSEQLLRQVESDWLADPTHTQIRDRLTTVVLQYVDKPIIQRVLITRWLQVPGHHAEPGKHSAPSKHAASDKHAAPDKHAASDKHDAGDLASAH